MLARRRIIFTAAALIAAPGVVFAQQCRITPRDALGPFYKSGAPQQPDLCASGSGGKERLTVSGRVISAPDCAPLAAALVEVWQADARGEYTQVQPGMGDDVRCLLRASLIAGKDGHYSYTTIFPGEYPGRPRHIHYRVSHKGYTTLVTQLYFANVRGIPEQLVSQVKRDGNGALSANFDIALARATGA